ncbi:hypothetical protein BJ741DRAFT_666300 [Chytriomyces cf. hyalinus JEL632]|nr:hypothetical protein BJ741DRAFT_666300 [Chytriomyces cf. hyalinus JEL632]
MGCKVLGIETVVESHPDATALSNLWCLMQVDENAHFQVDYNKVADPKTAMMDASTLDDFNNRILALATLLTEQGQTRNHGGMAVASAGILDSLKSGTDAAVDSGSLFLEKKALGLNGSGKIQRKVVEKRVTVDLWFPYFQSIYRFCCKHAPIVKDVISKFKASPILWEIMSAVSKDHEKLVPSTKMHVAVPIYASDAGLFMGAFYDALTDSRISKQEWGLRLEVLMKQVVRRNAGELPVDVNVMFLGETREVKWCRV